MPELLFELRQWIANDYGMKPSQPSFDFEELVEQFKLFCPDYNEPIDLTIESKSLYFALEIIYVTGPAAAQQQPTTEKCSRNGILMECYDIANKMINHIRVVDYNVTDNNPHSNFLIMSIHQAALISMKPFCELAELYYNREGLILLTNLAKAVFPSESIQLLADLYEVDVARIITIVNCSCQIDGQYLAKSDATISVCSVITAVKGLDDRQLQKAIILERIRQYDNMRKQIDYNKLRTVAELCKGGLAHNFNLIEIINTAYDYYEDEAEFIR